MPQNNDTNYEGSMTEELSANSPTVTAPAKEGSNPLFKKLAIASVGLACAAGVVMVVLPSRSSTADVPVDAKKIQGQASLSEKDSLSPFYAGKAKKEMVSGKDDFDYGAYQQPNQPGTQPVPEGQAAYGGRAPSVQGLPTSVGPGVGSQAQQAQGGAAPGQSGQGNPAAGRTSLMESSTGGQGGGTEIPSAYRNRMDKDYQAMAKALATNMVVYKTGDAKPAAQTSDIAGLPSEHQNLYDGADRVKLGSTGYMAAGEFVTAVVNERINTDYPSTVSATITEPELVRGATLLINYGGENLERAPATPMKLILNGKTFTLQGVVRTDLPGLNGKVDHHYARKIIPTMVNAGLAVGAVALARSESSDGNNINTRDQLYNAMLTSGISGIQNQISQIGAGKPEVTVEVFEGTEFKILLTEGVTIQ